jgi:TatD DNase family protein
MQLIDIGVNLTNKRLLPDVDSILEHAAKAGVVKLVVTGTSIEHSKLAIELCAKYPHQLFSTAGVHPHDASDWNEDSGKELISLLASPCVRAIGETGLDFNRMFSPRDQQIDTFQQQLEIACTHQKPAFLHQRDAFDSFHSLLKEYRHKLGNVVVHCFTDNQSALYALLDLDCHIGITGWICDERRGKELQSLVKDIPSNRLMLETDAPYLLPRDLPEKPAKRTNLPEYLPHILRTVARLRKTDPEELAFETLQTSEHFFHL